MSASFGTSRTFLGHPELTIACLLKTTIFLAPTGMIFLFLSFFYSYGCLELSSLSSDLQVDPKIVKKGTFLAFIRLLTPFRKYLSLSPDKWVCFKSFFVFQISMLLHSKSIFKWIYNTVQNMCVSLNLFVVRGFTKTDP